MNPRAGRLLVPVIVGGAALAITAYVGLVDPNVPGHYPLCPTKALTGLDCPFCGGLRATHALVHGDIASAVNHNALVALVVVPVLVVLWVRWFVREWRGPSPAADEADPGTPSRLAGGVSPSVLVWSCVSLMVAFAVARNVGAVPALAWLGSSVG